MTVVDKHSKWFTLQHAFARWLVKAGMARWVTEVPDVDRAPLMYVSGGREIQPDLLVEPIRDGQLFWLDSKGKSDVVAYANRDGIARTGIERNDLEAYRSIVAQTRRPCLVAFIHVAQQEVRCISVSDRLWQFGHGGGAAMAYVDWEPLSLLATWNGNPQHPEFQLVARDFGVQHELQPSLDGVLDVPRRYPGKGYQTLAGRRPPSGVKGFIQP